jgi:hypothetical protein
MQRCVLPKTRALATYCKRLSVGLLALALASPAFATLGGEVSSVEIDRAEMNGTVTVSRNQSYDVHEIKAENGTILREYASPDGRVFGVAWSGPFMPDFGQLLGTYLQRYSEGVKAHHAAGPGRRPLNIQQPNFVLQNSGHMRSFHGRAYDPQLLPQGVPGSDIR